MEPNLSDAGAGGGEDRLSALPGDLLVHILLKLRNAPAAARTSVLARRWRRAWALLPELHFPRGTHPDSIRAALTAHDAPALGHLFVTTTTTEVTLESVEAWLTIAARRLSGVLSFQISKRWNMAGERGALNLPCFEKATKVGLTLSSNGLALPPSGVFTRLADLELFGITLHGPCTLGDLVSTPRCPSLRRLCVYSVTGLLDKLIIHSKSLLQLELNNLPSLELLDVVVIALQDLVVNSCFSDHSRPVATVGSTYL
ncbi:hypothetical protein CFC21_004506 [Triticum aestivum]|uniref:F-box domain-containing protein n=1 Tax=Triticum aestivum TaxID=4565 RepID=A0A3B5Y7X5_WHEAT|nr:hypothetical protein CFC21_004506 [Triticum aestivum]